MNVGTIHRKDTKADEEAKELARTIEATMEAHFGRSEPASTIPMPYYPGTPFTPIERSDRTWTTNHIEMRNDPRPRTIMDIAKELLELPAREWIKVPVDVQNWATSLMHNEWD